MKMSELIGGLIVIAIFLSPILAIALSFWVRERIRRQNLRLNSRQLAEKIWNQAVRPCYDGMWQDNEPEPEDREAMLQEIEGMLEREAGLQPDAWLQAERAKNKDYMF